MGGSPLTYVDPTGELLLLTGTAIVLLVGGGFLISGVRGWSETMVATGGEATAGEQLLGFGLGTLGGFNPVGAYTGALGALGGYYGGELTGWWDPVPASRRWKRLSWLGLPSLGIW